ncbi:unnamed protein product, partial [Ectocarpus sp. 13 AM-2016]
TTRLTIEHSFKDMVLLVSSGANVRTEWGWIHVFLSPSASRAAAASALLSYHALGAHHPNLTQTCVWSGGRLSPAVSQWFSSRSKAQLTLRRSRERTVLNNNRTALVVFFLEWPDKDGNTSKSVERRTAWSRSRSSLACCRG